jgi:hypothetical protein
MTVLSTSTTILVERSQGRLTLYDGDDAVFVEPAAVGAPNTPTPTGLYYVDLVVDTPDDDPSGVAVLRLGAFTDLNDRRPVTGVPIIGGTNDPAILGKPVTSGGIAVANAIAAQLLTLVKAGTPVVIVP